MSLWGWTTQAWWVCRWRLRLLWMKDLLFHDSASPPVCQCGCGCSFWHILPLRWFSCLRSCCFCSKRHHREMPSLFLESLVACALKIFTNCNKGQWLPKNLVHAGSHSGNRRQSHSCLYQALQSHTGSSWSLSLQGVADNHSANLCSNRRRPVKLPGLIHGRSSGQSLISSLMRQTSFSQNLDLWFITIQGHLAGGNPQLFDHHFLGYKSVFNSTEGTVVLNSMALNRSLLFNDACVVTCRQGFCQLYLVFPWSSSNVTL